MSSRPDGIAIDIGRVAARMWGRRIAIVRTHALVATIAIAVVLAIPRRYTASVTLVPAPRDGLSLDFTGVGPAAIGGSLSLTGGPTPQDQLRLILMSRAVADSLTRRFELVQRWRLETREQARERLSEATRLVTPREGHVQVSVEAETPERARDLANGFANVAAEVAIRLKSSLAAQKRLFLQLRLGQIESDLATAAARLRAFEEQNGAVALPDQTREVVNGVARLESEIAVAEAQVAAARRYFTEDAVEVISGRERTRALRRQLDRIAGGGTTLGVAPMRLPALKQRATELQREQASLAAVAELLRRSYEQARVEEANPVPMFSVLDAADLPERPSFPPRGMSVLFACILTSTAWIAWALFAEARLNSPPLTVHQDADGDGWSEAA